MTFAPQITHQKHLTQSGRSTRSTRDIFNTLRISTNEPIREQEIKVECRPFVHFKTYQKLVFFIPKV